MRPAARGSIVRIFKRLRARARAEPREGEPSSSSSPSPSRCLVHHGASVRPRVTDISLGSRRGNHLTASPIFSCLPLRRLLSSRCPRFYLFPETCIFMHRGGKEKRVGRRRCSSLPCSLFLSLSLPIHLSIRLPLSFIAETDSAISSRFSLSPTTIFAG